MHFDAFLKKVSARAKQLKDAGRQLPAVGWRLWLKS
jgi:hypothetical protein